MRHTLESEKCDSIIKCAIGPGQLIHGCSPKTVRMGCEQGREFYDRALGAVVLARSARLFGGTVCPALRRRLLRETAGTVS